MTDKKTIMIVDDEEEFLQEFSEMLHLSGYEAKSFSNGSDAIKNFNTVKPHLVFLDLNMEGLDGFEVARLIKENSRTRPTPVIAVTGDLSESRRKRLRDESSVTVCLQKPVQPLRIISEIENIFAGHHQKA